MPKRLIQPHVTSLAFGQTAKLCAPKHAPTFANHDKTPRVRGFLHTGVFGHASSFERSFLAEKNYRSLLPPEQFIFPDLAYRALKNKSKGLLPLSSLKRRSYRKSCNHECGKGETPPTTVWTNQRKLPLPPMQSAQ